MAKVLLAPEAQAEYLNLPAVMQARVDDVFARLENWPTVSGAKALRHEWKGHYRIRTGDWRVIFREVRPNVLVVRIKHRSEVYED